MKHLLWLAFLTPVFAQAQNQLTISGKVKGLKEGSTVSVTDLNRNTDTFGKAVVRKESFELKADLKEPTLVSINLAPEKNIMTFLGNDAVKMSGDMAQWKDIQLKGSPSHDDFKVFQQRFDPLFAKLVKINQQLQMGANRDTLEGPINELTGQIQKQIDLFVNERPGSPVSAFVLAATIQLNDDILVTEKRYNTLKPAAVANVYGQYLKETIDDKKATAIGAIAADFTQADTLGHPVSLSSFRGKYVLIDFWASWCGPCRMENPNVVATYKRFSSKNFTVLGISLDRPGEKDKWLAAIHKDGLTWTHVSDLQYWNNAVAQQYHVQTIPQNFLIDPSGKIIAKDLRGVDLEAKLCEVLGCN